MQPSTINPLFGTQQGNTASKAQPASGAAFGEMLSRELGSRQAAHVETSPRTPPPPAAERTNTPQRPGQMPASPGGNTAGAASARARQESQRAQDRRDSNAQADAADKAQTAATTKNDGVTPNAASNGTSAEKRTDKAADNTANNGGNDATSAAEAAGAAAAGTAAAALLALVNSMAPRASVAPDAAVAGTAATAADPKLAAQKSIALPAGSGHEIAGDDAGQSDPAFDALLAQAAHATQARDAARGAGTGAGTEPKSARTLPDAGNGAAASGSAPALPAALAAKAESAQLPNLAQAAFERDAITARDGAAPPAAGAIGTPAMAGVLPAEDTGASSALTPRVGTPAWDNALGQKVVWMAAGAEQSALLTLNPPDLGPVQVVINVSNSHAEASFTAAQPEVRQALEAAMPKLKEMLADAGISLGQTSVGAGSPDQGGAQAQQQARQQARRTSAGPSPVEAATGQAARSIRIGTGGNGLVDTFA